MLVSGNYFSVLGVNALYGRVLTPEDDNAPNAHPLIVVSYGFWKNKMGQNPGAIGQSVRIGNYPFTIIGVTPPGFYGDTVGDFQDFWIPVTMQEQVMTGRKWLEEYNASWIHVIARLKSGTTVAQAPANVNVVLQQLVNGPLGAKLGKADLDNLKQAKIMVSEGGGGFSDLRGDFQNLVVVNADCRTGSGDCIRQRGQSDAGLGFQPPTRDRCSAGHWRNTWPDGSPTPDGERFPLLDRRRAGIAGGPMGNSATLLHLSKNDQLEASPDLRVFLFTAGVCILTGILFGLIPALRSRRVARWRQH